ncbi:hypothetical protein SUGI_0113310, partial [Cryptomeria japonica]
MAPPNISLAQRFSTGVVLSNNTSTVCVVDVFLAPVESICLTAPMPSMQVAVATTVVATFAPSPSLLGVTMTLGLPSMAPIAVGGTDVAMDGGRASRGVGVPPLGPFFV